MEIALAPMEGLADAQMRELLCGQGGIDWCVTEFVRVTDSLLPEQAFYRVAPELLHNSSTRNGTPVRVQLLGSDPVCLAENAARVAGLGAAAIDLNFGCPAKTVNKSRGGAILLKEPERLYRIAEQVRAALPRNTLFTAKMRLGYETTDPALECAQALEQGGIEQLVVHARTRLQGYKPPAHWEWVARIQDVVKVPVLANGEVWNLEDWQRCRSVSGVQSVMIGRGLVSRPDLARQIKAWQQSADFQPLEWVDILHLLAGFWQGVRERVTARHAPGRLKQWLVMLAREYPQAQALFERLRRETDAVTVDRLLSAELVRHA